MTISIETYFGWLKCKGFDLGDTFIRSEVRIFLGANNYLMLNASEIYSVEVVRK
jgi:hypothetical protein